MELSIDRFVWGGVPRAGAFFPPLAGPVRVRCAGLPVALRLAGRSSQSSHTNELSFIHG